MEAVSHCQSFSLRCRSRGRSQALFRRHFRLQSDHGPRRSKPGLKLAPGCGKSEPVPEAKEDSAAEEEWATAAEEFAGGEGGGLPEVMEWLEREAIMGEDEGREARDYDRRAKIFDKSSRVFQALKERNNGGT